MDLKSDIDSLLDSLPSDTPLTLRQQQADADAAAIDSFLAQFEQTAEEKSTFLEDFRAKMKRERTE